MFLSSSCLLRFIRDNEMMKTKKKKKLSVKINYDANYNSLVFSEENELTNSCECQKENTNPENPGKQIFHSTVI